LCVQPNFVKKKCQANLWIVALEIVIIYARTCKFKIRLDFYFLISAACLNEPKIFTEIVAGRRKSVDPTTLKEMRTARRQSLPRSVKAARPEELEDVAMAPEQKDEELPVQTEQTNIESSETAHETQKNEEQICSEVTKENEQDEGVLTPKRRKLEDVDPDNSDIDSNKSPGQTTSLCN
jgi:hypothetical protein